MAKKWPRMVAQRTSIKGHSFVYRLYLENNGKQEFIKSRNEMLLYTLKLFRGPENYNSHEMQLIPALLFFGKLDLVCSADGREWKLTCR